MRLRCRPARQTVCRRSRRNSARRCVPAAAGPRVCVTLLERRRRGKPAHRRVERAVFFAVAHRVAVDLLDVDLHAREPQRRVPGWEHRKRESRGRADCGDQQRGMRRAAPCECGCRRGRRASRASRGSASRRPDRIRDLRDRRVRVAHCARTNVLNPTRPSESNTLWTSSLRSSAIVSAGEARDRRTADAGGYSRRRAG